MLLGHMEHHVHVVSVLIVNMTEQKKNLNMKRYSNTIRWLRGASRYNNGATRYGKKYQIRLVMGWANDMHKDNHAINWKRQQAKPWGASEIRDFITDPPHILQSLNW